MPLWRSFCIGFDLLVNVFETVTITTLCILTLFFLVMFCYYIIMATTKISNWKMCYKHTLKFIASAIILVAIFGAVMFSILVYMFMILAVQPDGLSGVASALLPPVILSIGGWYVKTKLLNAASITKNIKEINPDEEKGSSQINDEAEVTV